MNMLNFKKNTAPDSYDRNGGSGGGTPPGGQVFTVDILEIETSRLNPRKTKGDNYETTKGSIKSVGLLQMLTITKQPDGEKYELYSGGNTRLSILKELHEEYLADGDTDKAHEVRYQQCLYVPYTNDLDVLVKHMAENEERSKMTFIDKARAVFQIKAMYLEQFDKEEVSNRKLVEHIHSLGWKKVNFRALTELKFAFEKLDDVIPLALNQGLGKAKTEQLRLWLGYAVKYITWLVEKHDYDYSPEQAEQLYFDVLADYDDDIEPINLDDFFEDYLFQLSSLLMAFDGKLKMDTVRFELEQVEELGYVPEEVPQEELSQQLRDTSTVPPMQYPEPRKPRTPKPVAEQDAIEADAETGGFEAVADNEQFEAAAKSPPPETGMINPETVTANTDDLGQTMCLDTLADRGKRNTIESFQHIIPQYEFNRATQDWLSYGDEDNALHVYPPYYSLDISDEDKRISLKKTLLSAEWPLQYLLLHVLSVYVIYHENDFEHSSMNKDETVTFNNLMKLWSEFSPKYCHYLGLCTSGLIERNVLQRQGVMEVHRLTQKHLSDIAAFEVLHHYGDGGE